MERFEREMCARFDGVVGVSEEDCTIMRKDFGADYLTVATKAGMNDDPHHGHLDCGTFNRWAVYDGHHPEDAIRDTLELTTGYLALCVDPALRSHGVGRAMVEALLRHPELATVRRFAAGVEPANRACVRCLEAAGFQCYAALPDFEGMLYYLLDRK